jgi:hypothetical protein
MNKIISAHGHSFFRATCAEHEAMEIGSQSAIAIGATVAFSLLFILLCFHA